MNKKYLTIVAVVAHGAHALKMFSVTGNCLATGAGSTCQGEKAMDAAGIATGSKTSCNFVTRSHTDATAIPEYWSGDLWGVYDTKVNLEAAKGVVCDTNQSSATAADK